MKKALLTTSSAFLLRHVQYCAIMVLDLSQSRLSPPRDFRTYPIQAASTSSYGSMLFVTVNRGTLRIRQGCLGLSRVSEASASLPTEVI